MFFGSKDMMANWFFLILSIIPMFYYGSAIVKRIQNIRKKTLIDADVMMLILHIIVTLIYLMLFAAILNSIQGGFFI